MIKFADLATGWMNRMDGWEAQACAADATDDRTEAKRLRSMRDVLIEALGEIRDAYADSIGRRPALVDDVKVTHVAITERGTEIGGVRRDPAEPALVPSDFERLRLCETILRYTWDNERTGHFDLDDWAEVCRLLLGSKSKPLDRSGEQLNQIMIQVRALAKVSGEGSSC